MWHEHLIFFILQASIAPTRHRTRLLENAYFNKSSSRSGYPESEFFNSYFFEKIFLFENFYGIKVKREKKTKTIIINYFYYIFIILYHYPKFREKNEKNCFLNQKL